MSKQVHYSISPLVEKYPDALYYLVFGEKSNGKSYQAKQNKDCYFRCYPLFKNW